MNNMIKSHFIRFICVLVAFLMLLSGCGKNPQPGKDTSSNDNPSSNNSSTSSDVSSEDSSGEDTSSDNNSSFKPATVPTVEIPKKDNTEKIIQPTKSDAGAFTSDKSAISGSAKKLTGFKMLTATPKSFELVEIEMDVPVLSEGANVYDAKDVDITATFTSSTGKTIVADAFYYEEYEFLSSGQLKGATSAKPKFRLRMSPQEEGTWDFEVTLAINQTKVDSLSGYFNVTKNNDGSGLIKVEPNRKQNFMTASGEPYVAIGQNIAWGVPVESQTLASKYVIQQMNNGAKYGANYSRIWLNCWGGLSIESKNLGLLNFKQSALAQWDKIFDEAESLDMKISFCLFTFAQFRTTGEDAYFDSTPWSLILDKPIDFFTDEEAKEVVEQELRYLVSRYGYSESVLTWELFNEVDLVNESTANTDKIRDWLRYFANYLKEIDPYKHLVSNSVSDFADPIAILSCFDFINYHRYNYGNLSNLSDLQKESWQIYKKPVLISECGSVNEEVTLAGGYITENLANLHRQNWVGVMGGGAGTGMNWWWEAMEEVDGFWDFQIVSEIAKEIPWTNPNMYMVRTIDLQLNNEQIEALGYRGKDFAYLWFYDEKYTHLNPAITDFDNVTAQVKLDDGEYQVRWVDTWTGKSIKKEVVVAKDGLLSLSLPKWSKDVVVAITRD